MTQESLITNVTLAFLAAAFLAVVWQGKLTALPVVCLVAAWVVTKLK